MDAEQRQRRRASNVMVGRLSVLYANAPHSWGVRLYDGGIMDAWKDLIGNLAQISSNGKARMRSSIGRFKEALALRHWIAHGRYWNLKRGVETFPPVTVATTIDDLYATLATVAKIDGLMEFH
jgi:hypothetical protein